MEALPTLDCYKYLDLDLAQFPNAIKDCSSILSLPIFPEISSLEIEYIAEKIREFFKLQS